MRSCPLPRVFPDIHGGAPYQKEVNRCLHAPTPAAAAIAATDHVAPIEQPRNSCEASGKLFVDSPESLILQSLSKTDPIGSKWEATKHPESSCTAALV